MAFFWVGENKQQMLGLWEVHNIEDFEPRHFAFGVNLEFFFKAWLEERGIAVIGSQGKGNQKPIVQRWMPAASVYFLDCDGNKLEFISMLHENPDELEYASYLSVWNAEHQENEWNFRSSLFLFLDIMLYDPPFTMNLLT